MRFRGQSKQHRWMRVAPVLLAGAAMSLSGCYYPDGYPRGYHYPVRYDHPHSYSQLKPKEKAFYGYGRHAGHPHGGPPGQLKKHRHHGGHRGY